MTGRLGVAQDGDRIGGIRDQAGLLGSGRGQHRADPSGGLILRARPANDAVEIQQ
jgi:hypothetical protein